VTTAATSSTPDRDAGRYPGPAPLVEVTRRDIMTGEERIESAHHGHLVRVDGTGVVALALGDPDVIVFPRSALKPLQATVCIELIERADPELASALTDAEIAIAWASHRGAPAQVAAVRSLLARSGIDDGALSCPLATSLDDPAAPASRVAHNCSGKHALFALTARALGLPVDREALLAPESPLQARVIAGMADLIGPVAAVGVDGCGAPALALPLVAVARAFAQLASGPRTSRVRGAGLTHPALIAGHERHADGSTAPVVDTALLAAGVVAKRGAEGVLAAGWHHTDGRRGGAAVKALDGSMRGAATALVALLEADGIVPEGTWREAVPQGGGRDAGTVRAVTAR